MPREQFGVTLYDAVSTPGGILGLQDQIAGVIHRGEDKKLQELKARRNTLRATLAQQLPALTAVDMGELLQRYPLVATL
jgi:hypothetical protein